MARGRARVNVPVDRILRSFDSKSAAPRLGCRRDGAKTVVPREARQIRREGSPRVSGGLDRGLDRHAPSLCPQLRNRPEPRKRPKDQSTNPLEAKSKDCGKYP